MNIIILGDKYRKGMKSKGCVGLIKYSKHTLLENQYKTIQKTFASSNIIYVGGFEYKKLKNYVHKNNLNIETVYNKLYEKYNNAYSLFVAKKFLNKDTLIIFGDTIINKSMFNNFDKSTGSQIFIQKNDKNSDIGCIKNDKEQIVNISFDLPNTVYGIYYICRRDTELIKDVVQKTENHNCFLFELLNTMIENKRIIKAHIISNRSTHITKKKKVKK
jgi:choline kinase